MTAPCGLVLSLPPLTDRRLVFIPPRPSRMRFHAWLGRVLGFEAEVITLRASLRRAQADLKAWQPAVDARHDALVRALLATPIGIARLTAADGKRSITLDPVTAQEWARRLVAMGNAWEVSANDPNAPCPHARTAVPTGLCASPMAAGQILFMAARPRRSGIRAWLGRLLGFGAEIRLLDGCLRVAEMAREAWKPGVDAGREARVRELLASPIGIAQVATADGKPQITLNPATAREWARRLVELGAAWEARS